MSDFIQPQVGVGAIVVRENQVLLVLRGKEPNANQWAIPGGRLRLGETLQQAAEREIREETGIVVKAGEVIYHFEHIVRDDAGKVSFHYVVLDVQADYIAGEPVAGDDALDARWVRLDGLGQLTVNSTTLDAMRMLYPQSF